MKAFMQKVSELIKLARLEKRWKNAAKVLSVIVVFCTTYMLILPAITLELQVYCGFTQHRHNDDCHEIRQVSVCGFDEGVLTFTDAEREEGSHIHTEECFISQRFFICDEQEHTHIKECFEEETGAVSPVSYALYSRSVQPSDTSEADSKTVQTYATGRAAGETYHVWLDGTCGGIMSLYEAGNVYQSVSGEIILPESFKSPSKYDYVINGWYDINNHKYYKPGERAEVTQNTVFYADWIAADYNVGRNNEHVVPSLDTNSFITTDLFDYSAAFNFHSVTHTGSISATSHSETWSVVQNSNVPYNNQPSLGFIFRDWDSGGKHISYAGNLARLNDNKSEITSQITDYVYDMSGRDIIDVLFNENTPVIGKHHVGEGNYLYQFMEEGDSNYDGIHNGYYYYDATLNAASYNQSEERFYVYDYLERTSDSLKDGFNSSGQATSQGAYSDFLPFNSPYTNNSNNKIITDYADKNGKTGNYQYDAKSTNQGSAAGNAGTNYWFGMKSEINFYLPNDTGTVDSYGNYGNISTHGDHMNFQFHGDDDIWVFIDGELVMDIGGLHGIKTGTIDFSTGTVTTDPALNNALVSTPATSQIDLSEGEHTLTIYYMERGSSQSNCAIYFNITPRYAMELIKKDVNSGQILDGAEFSVFTDENCTVPAELWNSEWDYENDKDSTNTFTTKNGKVYFWGISAGKVYYIKETKAPEGYPVTDDIIRVAMNNLGGSVCTTDSLRGEDEEHSDGFDVLESYTDEAIHLLSVAITNQKEIPEESGLTAFRVQKIWAQGSENIPDSVTVLLLADSALTGKTAELNEDNGWTYTWTRLAEKNSQGETIVYSVREVQNAGFTSVVSDPTPFREESQWIKTERLRDGDTFLLADKQSGNVLTAANGSFSWISREQGQQQAGAQWTSIADVMGFHLINGNGYRIILDGTDDFIPTQNGNRILYFYNNRLFAQNGNVYYYFNRDFSADSGNAMEFELYTKLEENLSGSFVQVTNTPVPENEQTSLSVDKKWSDGENEHANHSVTVKLIADGEDTGRTLTLDRSNSWKGTFDGLAYYNSDGSEVIYSVEEMPVSGYLPEYSALTVNEGGAYTDWEETNTLVAGEIYRFVYNGYALACNGNNVVSRAENPSDTYQQWEAVSYNNRIKLRNVGNNRYIRYSSGLSTNTSNTNNNTNVSLSGGKLGVGSTLRYIFIDGTSISTYTNSSRGTTFTVYKAVEKTKMPTYSLTVTNVLTEGYLLPATGGEGIAAYYAAGSAMILTAAALLAVKLASARKRRKAEACR